MSPVETFSEAGLLDSKLLCGHCIYVDAADIARMAQAGVHVVHIPKCNAASGRLAPTPDMQAAGLNMTLATDTQHGDMIELMRWALATARIRNGKIDDTWQPELVFDMATINGARALGLADEIGSLTVGKKAEFVVVDFRRAHLMPAPDPLGNLVHTGMGRDVEHVFVDGRAIVRDGRAALAHGDADVSGLKGGRIIDAVTGHGHHLTGCLQGPHQLQFLLGQHPREHRNAAHRRQQSGDGLSVAILPALLRRAGERCQFWTTNHRPRRQTRLIGNRPGGQRRVASDHHHPHPGPLGDGDRGRHIGPQRVGQPQEPHRFKQEIVQVFHG
jgi:hypothetical protein